MSTFLTLDSTAWTGIYTVFTAGLFVTAVVAALYAKRQWKSSLDDSRERLLAQREELRPYLTISIEPGGASFQLSDLVVRNVGRRPAKNVRINIDPPLVRAREARGNWQNQTRIRDMKILNEAIALVAPGQEIRAFHDSQIERREVPDLPTSHVAKVIYEDFSDEMYETEFTLDVEALEGVSRIQVDSVHNLSKTLSKIEKGLRKAPLVSGEPLTIEAAVESIEDRIIRESRRELDDLHAIEQMDFDSEVSSHSTEGLQSFYHEEKRELERRIAHAKLKNRSRCRGCSGCVRNRPCRRI